MLKHFVEDDILDIPNTVTVYRISNGIYPLVRNVFVFLKWRRNGERKTPFPFDSFKIADYDCNLVHYALVATLGYDILRIQEDNILHATIPFVSVVFYCQSACTIESSMSFRLSEHLGTALPFRLVEPLESPSLFKKNHTMLQESVMSLEAHILMGNAPILFMNKNQI